MRLRTETVGVVRGSQALGQSAPNATSNTDLYTCPKQRRASGVVTICSRDASGTTFRIALRAGGAALANAHYLAYDYALPAYSTLYTVPLDLEPDDVLTVYASSANLTFAFLGTTVPVDVT
jgi:hypothetical protein